MAPVIEATRRRGLFRQVVVHTGQHYDERLSAEIIDDLGFPKPDRFLGIGSGSHGEQTGFTLVAFERVLLEDPPELVVVSGDVNATLACALAAAKLGIPVAHVESGLRSGDWSMPEEQNRVLTDRLSDLLFTHSPEAGENLLAEGISGDQHPLRREHDDRHAAPARAGSTRARDLGRARCVRGGCARDAAPALERRLGGPPAGDRDGARPSSARAHPRRLSHPSAHEGEARGRRRPRTPRGPPASPASTRWATSTSSRWSAGAGLIVRLGRPGRPRRWASPATRSGGTPSGRSPSPRGRTRSSGRTPPPSPACASPTRLGAARDSVLGRQGRRARRRRSGIDARVVGGGVDRVVTSGSEERSLSRDR